MSQPPGHDAMSPWGDDATPSDPVSDASTPTSPLMIGDAPGVSATTQIQQEHHQPPGTLSGQVASLSGLPEFQPDKGTTLSGMKISSIFVVLISILSIGIISNMPNFDRQPHEEGIEMSWTDETHTNGTFTLPHAPIEKCVLGINTNPGIWWATTDCQGNIEATYDINVGHFNNTFPWENANLTIILPQAPSNGTEITTSIIAADWNRHQADTGEPIISDGISTEFTFPVNISGFESCRFDVIIEWEDQRIDAHYSQWRNNQCASKDIYALVSESVGFIDFETGEGEFRLSNNTRFSTNDSDSTGTSTYIWATYSEDYGVDSFAENTPPCFGLVTSIILVGAWFVLMFNAYREGLTKKANGMLVGMILGSLLVASGISIYFQL